MRKPNKNQVTIVSTWMQTGELHADGFGFPFKKDKSHIEYVSSTTMVHINVMKTDIERKLQREVGIICICNDDNSKTFKFTSIEYSTRLKTLSIKVW